MRIFAVGALLLTVIAAPQAQDDSRVEHSNSVERSFALGGTVRLDLSAGDYKVKNGADNRIRVAWHTRSPDDLQEAEVKLTVRGNEADIETSGPGGPGRNSFRVEIELPRRTHLNLHMTAGDLSIAGIEGNKDVRLRAGDLDIEVADPDQYRRVKASVTAGDISAQAFGYSTGGLFRSFTHEGKGPFELYARLWAGDLRLLRPKSDQ